MLLRKHIVRFMALAVCGSAVVAGVAAVMEAWAIAIAATAATLVFVAVLVVATSRRQYRAVERFRKETSEAISALHDELNHELVSRSDIEEIHAELGSVDRRFVGTASSLESIQDQLNRHEALLERTEGTLATIAESQRVVVGELGLLAGAPDALARTEKNLESTSQGQETAAEQLSQLLSGQIDLARRIDSRFSRHHSLLLTDSQAVHQLMSHFRPVEPLPAVGGWAMDPTGLLWLVRHIAEKRPELIVECGSGTSTLWSAMALRETGQGKVIALEHKPEFAQRTRDLLSSHRLSDWAEVLDAPLVTQSTHRGEFEWYDTAEVDLSSIDILLVDGPPGSTGKLARYPALPILSKQLAEGATIMIDDMHRNDEQECVSLWTQDYSRLGSAYQVNNYVSALTWK